MSDNIIDFNDYKKKQELTNQNLAEEALEIIVKRFAPIIKSHDEKEQLTYKMAAYMEIAQFLYKNYPELV